MVRSTSVAVNALIGIVEKIFALSIGLLSTFFVVRYFGPDLYGAFNYNFAIISILIVIGSLGLDSLIVREIVNSTKQGEVIFTAFIIRLVINSLLIAIVLVVNTFFNSSSDTMNSTLISILVMILMFKSFETFESYLVATRKIAANSSIRLSVYVIVAAIKITIVLLDLSIYHYAFVFVADVILLSIVYTFYFFNFFGFEDCKIDIPVMKRMLSSSVYLLTSVLMISIYTKSDLIMIGMMIDDMSQVGYYSAAVNISTLWYFIPNSVIVAFKPDVLNQEGTNNNESTQQMYSIILWIGIIVSFAISLLANFVINIVYGADFSPSIGLLSVLVWSGTLATLGSARSVWLISKGIERYNLLFVGVGALANIVMNLILIPHYGALGAAYSTIITQGLAVFVLPLLFEETRLSSIMIVKSMNFKFLVKSIRRIIK